MSSGHQRSPRRMTQRTPALDGLRALAALAVVLTHARPGGWHGPGPLGVQCFFALSGYLLTQRLWADMDRPGWVGRYAWRRALRILPLYWLAVGAISLAEPTPLYLYLPWAAGWEAESPALLPRTMLWSIGVEELAYSLLPWLLWRVRPARLPWALAGTIVGCLALRWELRSLGPWPPYAWPVARLDSVAWGVLAAWIVRFRPRWGARAAEAGPWLVGAAVGAALWQEYWPGAWQPLCDLWAAAKGMGFCALLVALGCHQLPGTSRVLAWPALCWVGRISYPLYLGHAWVVLAVAAAWPGAGTGMRIAAVMVGGLALAAVLHYGVERPVQRLTVASGIGGLTSCRPRPGIPLTIATGAPRPSAPQPPAAAQSSTSTS